MVNNYPLFSIIIPIYNVEKYLTNCLDSVVKQTYSNFECIMINDGSTDNSGKIAKEYVKKDTRFRLFSQENQGLSVARNEGIKRSIGKYLVFLDSDDFIEENALNILSDYIVFKNPDIIVSSSKAYYEYNDRIVTRKWVLLKQWKKGGEILNSISCDKEFVLAAWCIVVNKEFLQKNGLFFYPNLKHEDELWVPKVIIESENIALNDCPFYCNRADRPGSITQNHNIKKMFDKLFIIDELLKYSNLKDGVDKQALCRRCAKLLTGIVLGLYNYKMDECFKQLCKETQKRIHILKFETQRKYRLLYYMCNCFGVKNSSYIYNCLLHK